MRRALIVLSVVLSTGIARAEPLCVAYGPHVRLTGTIHKVNGFGRARETFDALRLDDPICTIGDSEDRQAPERAVSEVELMTMDGEHAAPEGPYIAVTGEMFHRFSAKHHMSVLLTVDDVEFLD